MRRTLGNGIALETLRKNFPSLLSSNSAFPKNMSTIAFLALITLMGS